MPNTNNDGISYDATASQVLGMSTSTKHYNMTLPKKKRRDITEYYPGQDDIHSINQLEEDITHWLFMEDSQNNNRTSSTLNNPNSYSDRSVFLSSSSSNIKQQGGANVQQQLDLTESGDWDDWNDDTSSSSLMQQGSSLMTEQKSNNYYSSRNNNITITATTNNNDTKLNQQQSSTSIIKSLFDYYSNNTNNRKAKPLIPRLRFIDFISSLNLPLESRQYTRQQASLIYQNLTKKTIVPK